MGIASEVGGIEGEDATDSMSRHQGGYARVVDLLTTHAVCAYHRFPFGVEGIGLPENGNQTLEDSQPVLDFVDRQSEPTTGLNRTGAERPKLGDVLRAGDERVAPGAKQSDGIPDDVVERVGAVRQPREDSCVKQVSQQSWSS